MDVTREIPKINEAIKSINDTLDKVYKLESARSVSISVTKLEEAKFWLQHRIYLLKPNDNK